jgi:FkbM family methyltransferase
VTQQGNASTLTYGIHAHDVKRRAQSASPSVKRSAATDLKLKGKEQLKNFVAFWFRTSALFRKLAVFANAQVENDRVINLVRHFSVDRIVDVGANHGQFAGDMRRAGFGGTIYSFEPTAACQDYLRASAANDPNWHIFGVGLGNEAATMEINIANNSGLSSSLLDEVDLDYGQDVRFVAKETVTVVKFDDVFHELDLGAKCLFKLDTQGFESFVLEGAKQFLARHKPIVFLESSLFPNYKGERLLGHIHQQMSEMDYRLVLVRKQLGNSHVDLQADFAFLHEDDFEVMLAELRANADL